MADMISANPPSPPKPGPAAAQPDARIRKAAEEFEAMALGQLLAPMFDTVDSSRGLFGGGDGEAAWKPMMVTELAKSLSRAGGIGLVEPVMQQMLRMQEAKQEAKQQAASEQPAGAPR